MLENRGKVRHEMILLQLKPGHTAAELLKAATPAERRPMADLIGLLIAEPGERSIGRILFAPAAGSSVVLVCNFRDDPSKPMHRELGMLAVLHVR